MPDPRQPDIRAQIIYMIEHGSSPQAEAARVLRDFMCCRVGEDLVDYGVLRPFGYSLRPGRVVAENRELRDIIECFEAEVAGDAQMLHDGHDRDRVADSLAKATERTRARLERIDDR